ncbi:calcitonin gene-related peptide type 1 receptor-like isoform X2 [Anoplophora glabripennis]|uniref:calcitonin gene-related peptide type 1 receptor-like isoform X2 n=1 Tax=Anoplophora glabripennis TaxID=217634 RepID=UPI000873EC61|nr:calcitonin gene-related peptide type 1 receptor-like isoform X2 [Anoplophora glabripennis]
MAMCALRFFIVLLFKVVIFTQLTFVNAREEFCGLEEETPKKCLLRKWYYDEKLWNHFAGFNCYNFTDTSRLRFKYNFTAYPVLCRNENTTIPIAVLDGVPITFFDFTNDTAMSYVRKSFRTTALFNNFLSCCYESVDCCQNKMDEYNIWHNETHCPAIWDAWTCFPPTKANTIARQPCSSQAYQSPEHVCRLESQKECKWNPTYNLSIWVEKTDYSVCAIAPVYERRHTYHVVALCVCTGFCLPAIVIFFLFEKLRRTTRVILHRNLLIAICIRNILTTLTKTIIILDALKSASASNDVMANNGVPCRILAFFECCAKNLIYACMLVDGFYLHKIIVKSFTNEIHIKYLYAAVAVLTLVPSMAWAITKGASHGDNCWMVDTNGYQWINDGFRIAVLAVNTFLLLDIIRIMLLKMKHGNTTRQTKAAFRATLFLIPLFGIHILFTAKKIVYDDSCLAEDVYEFARYTMEALQGVFVAILFCYANAEVHNEIRNGYRKFAIYCNQKFGWNLKTQTLYRRRTTAATYVQPEYDN